MIQYTTTHSGKKAAIVESMLLNELQDFLDLIANLGTENCDCMIINEKNINSCFFDLKTGFAGDVLQKFSNYGFGLAIVGDFSKYESKSLKDFIRESNRRKHIVFTATIEDGLRQL